MRTEIYHIPAISPQYPHPFKPAEATLIEENGFKYITELVARAGISHTMRGLAVLCLVLATLCLAQAGKHT